MKKLVAILLLIASVPAQAQSWAHVGSAGDFEVYVDTSRLIRDGAFARFWIKRQRAQEQEGVAYFLSQVEINCTAQTGRVLYTAAYGAAGAVVRTDPEPVPAEPIPPGTMYDDIRQQVC